jgi:hypothetical protein
MSEQENSIPTKILQEQPGGESYTVFGGSMPPVPAKQATSASSVPLYFTDFNLGWPDAVRIVAKPGAYLDQAVAVADGEGNSAAGWIKELHIGGALNSYLGLVRCDPSSWYSDA